MSAAWMDLTVEDAERVRDFYAEVAGWRPEPVDMGGYSDFNMCDPDTGQPVAGVCFARGGNAGLPPVWLAYFTVSDLDASLAAVREGGGEVLAERTAGEARYAVIRDPAGAACALWQKADGGA